MPADRAVKGPLLASVHVRNAGPRAVEIQGVRPGFAGRVRIVGARRHPQEWSDDSIHALPFAGLKIPPGERATLSVLLGHPACRGRRKSRAKPARVPLVARLAGGGSVRLTVPVRGCGEPMIPDSIR